MTEAPSPFSANIPHFQLSWDSTSLGWFKECPKLYHYHMILGYSPRSKGIHLYFGGLYASGVEHYAHAVASGKSHDEATLIMVKWVLWNSGTWTVPDSIDGAPIPVRPLELSVHGQWVTVAHGILIDIGSPKNLTFTPWESDDPIKNRYTLIRSLVWNVEDRLTNPFKTVILSNGKPAVELSFNFPVFEIEGETISLSGHMDELVTAHGQTWVKDDKTSKGPIEANYFKQYTPHNQMTLYSIAGKVILGQPVAGVLVRAAQIGVNFTRFATQQVPRPPAVLAEWLEDTKAWVRLARQYAIEGHWPMNDKSCSNYGGCPFQKVCAVSPSHRKAWLEQDYEHREWNPLAVRGDI